MTISRRILRLCFLVQLMLLVALLTPGLYAAEYSCASGDVTCLIASINDANAVSGEHIISLEPGSYTLLTINNISDGRETGLPSITGRTTITAAADEPATIIERDSSAPFFRIFHISASGHLILEGVTIQRGGGLPADVSIGSAIFNRGTTSLYDSIIRDSSASSGAIHNTGTLNVFRSIIVDNHGGHEGGGIQNNRGNTLVENSTIAHNSSIGAGGIANFGGSLVIRNSAIHSNSTDIVQPGGGIFNAGGNVDILNSTIAQNQGSRVLGGGGIYNRDGTVSITNSTIRENHALSDFRAAGLVNDNGILRIQNSVVAGNILDRGGTVSADCSGTITSLGNNVIGDLGNCDINTQGSDRTGDPGLASLVQMGEDDQAGKAFYPVLVGSVVINAANPTVCSTTDQLGNPRVGSCDIGPIEFQERAQVAIDIRPRSDANRVNPHSTKSINVAIISENGFDAGTVDSGPVRFGASGIEAAPVNVAHRDVNRDGQRDLVLRFQIQDLGVACGATSLTLIGQLLDGQPIIGSAPIATTGCKQKKLN
jgi:hypothetical protein